MRRWIDLFLVVTLFGMLASCAVPTQQTAAYDPGYVGASSLPASSADFYPYESANSASAPSSAEPTVSIPWKTMTYASKDSDGYTYQITVKVSPWILLSNEGVLRTAWQEVNRNRDELPGFSDWGLTVSGSFCSGNFTGGYFGRTMTDMYYCVGTIRITNTTSGWDITENNKRSPTEYVIWNDPVRKYYEEGYHTGIGVMSKVFYQSNVQTRAGNVTVMPSMKSNAWGPVSFIIMAPENYSPKYPDGEYVNDRLQGYFSCYDSVAETSSSTKVGVFGKDGAFISPQD